MVLPNFNRGGTPAASSAQDGQPPAQGGQIEEEPIQWERGWDMPENTSNLPPVQEFVGRLHELQGVGKKGKNFPARNGQSARRREFLCLNFDWVHPIVVRDGATIDTGTEDEPKPFMLEIPMSGAERSGMGMFRQSIANLTGIALVNRMLKDKLYELQDNGSLIHMVSVDGYKYGRNNSGDMMQGLIWQVVDIYKEGDDGVPWSTVQERPVPEFPSMFDAVNQAARAGESDDGEDEQPSQNSEPARVVPSQLPDFSAIDWSAEIALALQDGGVSWQVLRSSIRDRFKDDAAMVTALFTESNEFPSVVLEYFLTEDLMRRVSEDGEPVHVVGTPQ